MIDGNLQISFLMFMQYNFLINNMKRTEPYYYFFNYFCFKEERRREKNGIFFLLNLFFSLFFIHIYTNKNTIANVS